MLKYCVRCKTRHILRSFWAIEKVPKPKRKTGENRGPKFDQRGVGEKASSTTLLSVSLSTPFFLFSPPSSRGLFPSSSRKGKRGRKCDFQILLGVALQSGSSSSVPRRRLTYTPVRWPFFFCSGGGGGVGGRRRTYWPVAVSLPWLAALPREERRRNVCFQSLLLSSTVEGKEGDCLLLLFWAVGEWL